MVPETLNELLSISNELASLKGKPPQVSKPPPSNLDLHPDLVELLGTRAYALKRLGIDAHKVDELTEDARKRGLRRKVFVFGRGRRGATWYATPERKGKAAKILVIDRANRLATTELDLDGFVDHCIAKTKEAIEAEKEAEAERQREAEKKAAAREAAKAVVKALPKVPPPTDTDAPVLPTKLRGTRKIKVRLPDSNGATVVADGTKTEFSPEDFAYIIWSMDALQILPEEPTPDLSRWERRCLRACRMDAVPAEGTKERAEYDAEWLRITTRDRSARTKASHGIPSWKLTASGVWILNDEELDTLRRAKLSTPPRHTPSKAQKALWKRWTELAAASAVELHVH